MNAKEPDQVMEMLEGKISNKVRMLLYDRVLFNTVAG